MPDDVQPGDVIYTSDDGKVIAHAGQKFRTPADIVRELVDVVLSAPLERCLLLAHKQRSGDSAVNEL